MNLTPIPEIADTQIKKIITLNNCNFIMKIITEETLLLQIGKEFDNITYEKSISKEILVEEDKKWEIFDKEEEITSFICNSLENNETNDKIIEFKGSSLLLNLKFTLPKGKIEYSFVLVLEEKRQEIDINSTFGKLNEDAQIMKNDIEKVKTAVEETNGNFHNLTKEIKSIQENFQSKTSKITTKINSINDKSNLEANNFKKLKSTVNKMTDALDKNTDIINSNINQIKESVEENSYNIGVLMDNFEKMTFEISKINNEVQKYWKELKIFKENITTQMKKSEDQKVSGYFSNVTDKRFFLSNGSKTIRKISGGNGWTGFMSSVPIKNEGIQEFTIKVDNIDGNAYLTVGFAIFGTQGSSGYHTTNSSWMCYFGNGGFYNAGSLNSYFGHQSSLKPAKNDIISVCIDTSNHSIFIKLNGKVASSNRLMSIFDYQKECLFPCIDIYSQETQISIL